MVRRFQTAEGVGSSKLRPGPPHSKMPELQDIGSARLRPVAAPAPLFADAPLGTASACAPAHTRTRAQPHGTPVRNHFVVRCLQGHVCESACPGPCNCVLSRSLPLQSLCTRLVSSFKLMSSLYAGMPHTAHHRQSRKYTTRGLQSAWAWKRLTCLACRRNAATSAFVGTCIGACPEGVQQHLGPEAAGL